MMDDSTLANVNVLVKDNIRTLSLPQKTFEKPIAVIFVGPPFSGKTTLVEYCGKRFPLAVLSESKMAAFLAPRATFFKRGDEEVFLLASKTIGELFKQKISLIYDASIKRRSDREILRKIAQDAGGKLVVIELLMPKEEALKRLEAINAQIIRGDRKGFIMDKAFLDYEFNSIEKPVGEDAFTLDLMGIGNANEKMESIIGRYLTG